MSERDNKIVERIYDLTMDDELDWRPHYEGVSMTSLDDDTLQDTSQPDAYVLVDSEYGFGIGALKVETRYGGQDEYIRFFLAGDQVDISSYQARNLRDAVKAYLDKVRLGEEKTPQEKVEERVEEAVEPYMQKVRQLRRRVQQLTENNNRLLTIVESAMQDDEEEDTEHPLPLTAETLREAVYLMARSSSEAAWELVEEGLTPAQAESIVQDLQHAREKYDSIQEMVL